MPDKTKKQTCLISICVLSILILPLQLSCKDNDSYTSSGKSAARMRAENKKAKEKFEYELHSTIQKTEAQLEPYRKNGMLKVKLTPQNGEVYINDGMVTIPEKGLMLPVGTYDVKAVWPDGKEITKKVFLTPALQQMPSYSWKFNRNTSGGSGNQDSNISINAPLSPTEVNLTKP